MRDLHDVLLSTDGKHYKQIAGTSTESKPTENLCTGSMYLEVDTAKLYFSMKRTPVHGVMVYS